MMTKNRIGLLADPAEQRRQLEALAAQPARRGRAQKWEDPQKAALIVEVERRADLSDPGRGVSWACQTMANREPWRSFLEQLKIEPGLRRDALRRAYYRASRQRKANWLAKMTADYVRLLEEAGQGHEWEALLVAIVSRD